MQKIKIIGLLEAFCYLALAVTVLAFFARWHWTLDLTANFRVHYVVAMTLAAVLFALCKKWKPFVIFTLGLLVNLYYVVPDFIPTPKVLAKQTKPLKLMSFNVLCINQKYQDVISYLSKSKCDFIVLTEVTVEWERNIAELKSKYPYQKGLSRGDSFGIRLLSRLPFTKAEVFYLEEYGVPSILAEIVYQGQTLSLIATHPLPPRTPSYAASRNKHLRRLMKKVQKIRTPLVIAGDLNTTPWSPYFGDFLTGTNLKDARRGHGICATWPSTLPLLWIPIDHCLVSQDVQIHSHKVGANHGSDHYSIVTIFSVPKK